MKTCKHCGKSVEGTKDASRKIFCNAECYRQYRLAQPLHNKSSGHYRARAATPEKVCVRCGSTENVHVHHVDRNVLNDARSNLEELCSICHHKEHARAAPTSTCAVCGVRFKAASHRNRNKICSALCAKAWGRICAERRWAARASADCAPTVTPSSRKRPPHSSRPPLI